MTLAGILSDIHALEGEKLEFEKKYGIRSEIFYTAYMNGEEPENDEWVADFGEWASVYETLLEREAEYREEIKRVQKDPPSIIGLAHVAA